MKNRKLINRLVLTLVPAFAVALPAFAQESNSAAIYYNPLFEYTGVNTKYNLCSDLVKDLTEVPGFKALERKIVDKAIQEAALGNSGLVTAETNVAGGKIMKAATIIQLSGINYAAGETSVDGVLNALVTDSKTGRIISSQTSSYDNTDELFKSLTGQARANFAKPSAVSSAAIPRKLTSVEVKIPVEYNFSCNAVFTTWDNKQVIRQSDQYEVYEDGSKKRDKENMLHIVSLKMLSGSFNGLTFSAAFESGILRDEYISIEGRFNKDKSRIESIKVSRVSCNAYNYGNNNEGYTQYDDEVYIENLVYNSVLRGYEYKNGISKISKVKSNIDEHEASSGNLKEMTLTHRFKNIDESRLDYNNKPLVPLVWLYSSDMAAAPKPVKKIYLRGNWKGYGYVAGTLGMLYPEAELYDQTENYKAVTAFENQVSGSQAAPTDLSSPASPKPNEVIITFNSTDGRNVTATVVTAKQTDTVTLENPFLDSSVEGQTTVSGPLAINPGYNFSRLYQLRCNVFANNILKAIGY